MPKNRSAIGESLEIYKELVESERVAARYKAILDEVLNFCITHYEEDVCIKIKDKIESLIK